MLSNAPNSSQPTWRLIGNAPQGDTPRLVRIRFTPFEIGRHPDRHLLIPCCSVSSRHAEIVSDGESLWVRDLQSTNGTFVNGVRITSATKLKEGDILQFAKAVFRVGVENETEDTRTIQGEESCDQALALVQFDKLMTDHNIIPYFQPVVSIQDGKTIGYEVLIRSRLFGLQNPRAIFLAAALLELEAEVSRLSRSVGTAQSVSFEDGPIFFLNTHPKELDDLESLARSLRDLRKIYPDQRIALEIHEAAITQTGVMRQLQELLKELDFQLAYDDFGSGQARLVELAEVPPDYLKFDMQLVQGIHAAPARQQMLARLVQMARELGIAPLAEGLESEADVQTCRELGFELAQGYYFGRPAPASRYSVSPAAAPQ